LNLDKIKQWIYRKYEEESQPEINELVWLEKKVKVGEKLDWTFLAIILPRLDSPSSTTSHAEKSQKESEMVQARMVQR